MKKNNHWMNCFLHKTHMIKHTHNFFHNKIDNYKSLIQLVEIHHLVYLTIMSTHWDKRRSLSEAEHQIVSNQHPLHLVGVGHTALPCIKDGELVWLGVGVQYDLQVPLVLLAPTVWQTDLRLATANNGSLALWVDPRQNLRKREASVTARTELNSGRELKLNLI